MTVTLFKREVEFAMPPRMIFAISVAPVFTAVDTEEGPKRLARMRALAKAGSIEPIEHYSLTVQKVIAKHVDRILCDITAELDQQPGLKVAGAIWFFIKELTDSGYLELYEGSTVAEACELFLPMFEHLWDEPVLAASAKKHGLKALKKAQEKGYYV